VIRPVRAVQAAEPGLLSGVEIPGRAKATREVNLSFLVPGRMVDRAVFVGDEVKQGQIVAKLNPRDFQNELRTAQGRLSRAKAAEQRARSDYRRIVKIRDEDPGAASESLLEQKREALDGALANMRSLKAKVSKARDQLNYTKLKAPFDGRIVATYVENFEDVQAKEPVVRLLDTSRIEMIINVPEMAISYAPDVKHVYVIFDAFPDTEIKAYIKEIGTEASQTTRTYPVNLIMDQPKDVKILPGMAGKTKRVDYVGDIPSSLKGIALPTTAVFRPDASGKSYVWIIDEKEMKVRLQEVKTGDLTEGGIIILEGVKAGQWVAIAGVHHLKEGQKVSILKASEAGPK
jgi:RND family efflux transporter MFP subunit